MSFDIFVFLVFLAVIAFIDYKKHIIPDSLLLSTIIFRILYVIFLKSYMNILYSISNGLLVMVPFLLLTLYIEKKTGKFQTGGGDIKLMGCMGFYLDPMRVLIIMFIASIMQLSALKYTGRQVLPLAPAVFIATIICLFLI